MTRLAASLQTTTGLNIDKELVPEYKLPKSLSILFNSANLFFHSHTFLMKEWKCVDLHSVLWIGTLSYTDLI